MTASETVTTGSMTIRQFEIPGLAQYSYVVASDGEAVVIDAIRDFDRYTQFAAEQGLRITHIMETHIHADFAAGSVGLAEATGTRLDLSGYDEGEVYRYAMPHRRLMDGDSIAVGRLRLQALHTPGHTPEHVSFVLFDPESKGEHPVAIFSGDFLFTGSLGRPDLLGEEARVGLAHELYRSVHERIAHLPDDVVVYPGHGAGSLCGAGIGAGSQSTLGHERTTQVLFQLNEKEFVRQILASVPPMPVYYPRMKRLNAAGAEPYRAGDPLMASEPQQVEGMAEKGAVLLDLRTPVEFAARHLRGAINLGAGANLSLWAGWLLDAGRDIVLLDASGDAAVLDESRRALARVGLDRIAGALRGGMAAWPGLLQATPLYSPAEVAEREDAFVLDVRSQEEWVAGHIADSLHIPLGDLPGRMAELPKDREVVAVCGSGYRASAAASLVAATGREAASLEGGTAAWMRAGLPLEEAVV